MNDSMQRGSAFASSHNKTETYTNDANRGFRPSRLRRSPVFPSIVHKGFSFSRIIAHVIAPRPNKSLDARSSVHLPTHPRPRSALELKWASASRDMRTCTLLGVLDRPPPQLVISGCKYAYPQWDLSYTVPNLRQRDGLTRSQSVPMY